jgi:hypothetical protein
LDALPGTIYAGSNNTLAAVSDSAAGTYLVGSPPDDLFDNNLHIKYTSRGSSNSGNSNYAGLNTSFYMTRAQGQPLLIGFRFGNPYSYSECELLVVTIEGTNCANVGSCMNWTLLYNGS